MGGYPVLWVAGAVLSGVVAGEIGGGQVLPWAVAVSLLGALTVFAAGARRGTVVAAMAALFAVGGLAVSLHPAPRTVDPPCGAAESRWQAIVDAPIHRLLEPSSGRLTRRTVLKLQAQRCGERWVPAMGRVTVGLWQGAGVARGDRIEARLIVEPLSPKRNPTDADPVALARQRRVNGRALARSSHVVLRFGGGALAWLDRSRRRAAVHMEATLGPMAPLAKALGLGDRASITVERRDRWARAGLAHLLAISGLHVGLVAAALVALLAAVLGLLPGAAERFSVRRWSAATAIGPMVVFCLWTGASTSTVRATIMVVAYLLGRAMGRPTAALNALGVAAVGIVLLDPVALYDVGFLLSFAAVAALLILPPLGGDAAHSRWRRFVFTSVTATVVATLATAAIVARVFGQISIVAPLANLIAVPVGAGLATPVAVITAITAAFVPSLSAPLEPLLGLLLRCTDWIGTVLGSFEFSALTVAVPTMAQTAAYGCALFAGLLWLRHRRRWLALSGAGALSILVGLTVLRWLSAADGLTIIHPYVGQGDAAILILPDDQLVLFDAAGPGAGGGWDPGRSVVGAWLRRLGRHRIDLAIVSHPQADHMGGLAYLSRNFAIQELWHAGPLDGHSILTEVEQRVKRGGGRVRDVLQLPDRTVLGGVEFEVLHPRVQAGGLEGLGANDSSVVLSVRYGKRSMLFTGDIERAAEARAAARVRAIDVLKAPHHGSRTSSSEGLLEAAKPKVALISCGHGNRFGFPAAEVLARYERRRMQVIRTDKDGAITMWTDGQRWRIDTELGRALEVPPRRPLR